MNLLIKYLNKTLATNLGVFMRCMTVKEIDELLEKISKNIDIDSKEDIEITETNEELDKSLHECLKEAERLFEEKSNKEEHIEDENFCSFSNEEINKLLEETEKLLQGKENYIRKFFKNEEKGCV